MLAFRFSIITVFCCLLIAPSVQAQTATKKQAPEFETIFDGSNLDAFRGYRDEKIGKGWKIDDGNLMFDGSGGGDIITKKQYDNFELKFEWKVTEGANSGIMYRVSTGDNAPYFSGPEYQILDDAKHADGKNPATSAGSLYALYVPENKTLKPVGQWNTGKIILDGNQIQHWLNGTKVVQAEFKSDDWNKKVKNSKFSSWTKFGKNTSGHLCFQDHGNKVWFRNIKIRPIKK